MNLQKRTIHQIKNAHVFIIQKEILLVKKIFFYTVSEVFQFLSHLDKLVVKFKTLIAISLNSRALVLCIIHQLANQLKVIKEVINKLSFIIFALKLTNFSSDILGSRLGFFALFFAQSLPREPF